jgi:hypothetical protein
MKRCPKCGQSFADPDLNFCLNDGELLLQSAAASFGSTYGNQAPTAYADDDSPPTLMMNDPRTTNPVGWTGSSSPVPWQSQAPSAYQSPQFGMQNYRVASDQTLPTVSLVLGIFACLFVCCYGGIWLGIPAVVVGYLGMKNADADPNRYGGRGLAIAGLVLGIITFFASIAFIIMQIIGGIS